MKQRIEGFNEFAARVRSRVDLAQAGATLWRNLDVFAVIGGMAIAFVVEPAWGQSTSTNALPSVSTAICSFANTISGPIAGGVAVLVVAVGGLMLAVGEIGGVFKTFLGIAVGVGVAVGATSLVKTIFPSIIGC